MGTGLGLGAAPVTSLVVLGVGQTFFFSLPRPFLLLLVLHSHVLRCVFEACWCAALQLTWPHIKVGSGEGQMSVVS